MESVYTKVSHLFLFFSNKYTVAQLPTLAAKLHTVNCTMAVTMLQRNWHELTMHKLFKYYDNSIFISGFAAAISVFYRLNLCCLFICVVICFLVILLNDTKINKGSCCCCYYCYDHEGNNSVQHRTSSSTRL